MKRTALVLLVAAFAVTLAPGPWGDDSVSDLYVYRHDAGAFRGGSLPYRDVFFEYPPLAAPVIALPALAGTGEETYRLAFAALALGLGAAVLLLTGALAERTGGDRRTAMLAVALAPLVTGAMIRTHFDLAPVALTLGALALVCAGRTRTGFAVLGLAVMTKGYPLVVAPVALAWLLARGRPRAALAGGAVLAATVGSIAVATLLVSPSGAVDAVDYHRDRPLQIESTPALVVQALDAAGAGEAARVDNYRSNGLLHPADDALTVVFAALLVVAVGLCALACTRDPGPRELVLASLAATVAFAVLGKVLSPQYLIWVVPLAALALAWRRYALAATAAGSIALTLVEFPAHYGDVVNREPLATWLVASRNALLLATLWLALRELAARPVPGEAAARWPWPGRRRRPRPAPR